MCHGENTADHCAAYLNAQLAQLHANSVDCVEKHGNGLIPDEEHKYSFALAEFYHGCHRPRSPSKQDLHFYAAFDKPRLAFICNHEAILYLKINHGHFSLNTHVSGPANSSDHRDIKNYEVAFRVPFEVHAVKSPAATGPGGHMLQVMVFDYDCAKMVLYPPVGDAAKSALGHYLQDYLHLLRHAGHHVLYSLPDFDDDRRRAVNDFREISQAHLIPETDTKIHGISLSKINEYLLLLWQRAARLANARSGLPDNLLSLCLAEFKSTWDHVHTDTHFHVLFGAPKVRAICEKEVLLVFTVDEVHFYDTDDFDSEPTETFKKWEIAVMVQVVEEKDIDGFTVRYGLDFHTARLCQHRSTAAHLHEEAALHYWDLLVDFVMNEYLTCMEEVRVHIIYQIDIRSPERFIWIDEHYHHHHHHHHHGEIEYHTDPEGDVVICGEHESPSCGYESIEIVTQVSIMEYFRTIWETALTFTHSECLRTWKFENYFEASFGPLTMRLLSNDKAIVFINLEQGTFRELRRWALWSEGTEHEFSNCKLAFEVDLKLVDHTEVVRHSSDVWAEFFRGQLIYKQYGVHEHAVIKHLVLDFHNAVFVHELSSFGTLQGDDRSALTRMDAIVHYVADHYIKEIAHHGHHIIRSMPVWMSGEVTDLCITSVQLQVYGRRRYHRHTCMHYDIHDSESPVIVILGMYHFRPMPTIRMKWSATLVITTKKEVHGIVCLSRKSFLDRILELLAGISARTTVIPTFAGVEDGEWRLELTTWAKHERKVGQPSHWKQLVSVHDGFMEFEWLYHDEWTYKHQSGHNDRSNGSFSLISRTHNFCRIPIGAKRHNGLEIMCKGTTTFDMGFEGSTDRWSSKACAEWETIIRGHSSGSGLHISVASEAKPVVKVVQTHGVCHMDARALLQQQLVGAVDITAVLGHLKSTLEGTWKYSFPAIGAYALYHPAFNTHGDLLLELRTYVEERVVVHAHGEIKGPRRSGVASPGGRRPITPRSPRASRVGATGVIQRAVSWMSSVSSIDDEASSVRTTSSGAATPAVKRPSHTANGNDANGNGVNGAHKLFSQAVKNDDGHPPPGHVATEIDIDI